MWGFSNNFSKLNSLLDNPETTIETILDESSLNAGIRNDLPALYDFIIKPTNMNRMLDIALAGFVPETSLPQKTTRMAVSILATGTSKLMNTMISKSPEYVDRIKEFPNSEFKEDPKCCGHFYRIVESLVKNTAGKFLQEMPHLKNFLVTDMSCLGLRQLFCFLCIDYSQNFGIGQSLFADITNNANNNKTGWFVMTALREILKENISEVDDLVAPQIIDNIMIVATNDELEPLIRTEAFSLMGSILNAIKDDPDDLMIVQEVINEVAESYDFSNEPSLVASAALKVFNTSNADVLMKVLTNDVMTSYKDGIIKSFKEMSSAQLTAFVDENNLIDKIIEAFGATKTNYHISLLANVIYSKYTNKCDKWEEFVNGPLKEKNELREKPYGEDLNESSEVHEDLFDSDSLDSDDDSDDDDDYCNEKYKDEQLAEEVIDDSQETEEDENSAEKTNEIPATIEIHKADFLKDLIEEEESSDSPDF